MSSRQLQQNLYGFPSPLSKQAYPPIISNRAPLTTDYAPLGSIWVNQLTNSAYVLTSIVSNSATWDLINNAGGSASFTTLTVSGATTLATTGASVNTFGNTTGATSVGISVGTGGFTLTGVAGSVLTVGTGVTTGSIAIGAALTTGSLALGSSTGLTTITPATTSIVSPASTATINANVGVITCTGFTTANAGATQSFTITNNKITTSSYVNLTVASLNASTNGALLSVKGLVLAANTMTITVANNGAGSLGSGDNILLAFSVNS